MIYLLRHGLDDEQYIGGWSNVSLIDEGIKQIMDVSKFIKNNIDLVCIYSSDIKRAKQSANILNSYLGLPIHYMEQLREQDKGFLTGIKKSNKPSIYDNMSICDRYNGGESLTDLYLRINELLDSIIVKKSFQNSILVTHRGVINMIYYILNNITLDMNKERFDVSHASLHEFDTNNRVIKKII